MDPLARAIVVYSVQIGAIVVACTAALRVSRVPYASTRLFIWRATVLACLLLPLWPARVIDVMVQRVPEILAPFALDGAVASTDDAAVSYVAQAHRNGWGAMHWLPLIIVIGALVRLAWLAASMLALRRLRTTAGEVIDIEELRRLGAHIAPQADVRWHAQVPQPVSFGLRDAVVLLPASLRSRSIDIQRAALSHELFHVARADWLSAALEEAVLSVFWFHPAMWWAMTQIQLSREQTVDELSIAATGSRREYLRALLEFADASAVAGATAFIGRQLAQRIAHLSKENVMTRARFGLTIAVLTAVLSLTVWSAASALPLRQTVRYEFLPVTPASMPPPGATFFTPRPQLFRASAPPPSAQGTAQHADASYHGGAGAPLDTLAHDLSTAIAGIQTAQPSQFYSFVRSMPEYPAEALKYSVGATLTLNATVLGSGVVVDIVPASWQLRISRDIQDPGYWSNSPQKAFIDAAIAAVREWQYPSRGADAKLAVTLVFDPNRRVVTGAAKLTSAAGATLEQLRLTAFSNGGAAIADPLPVRVGGDIRAPRKIKDVAPDYPEVARSAGVQGVVIVEVTIGADGSVVDARVLRSVPLLDQAALDAVRQWVYEPVLKDGVATPVIMTVTVNFSLR